MKLELVKPFSLGRQLYNALLHESMVDEFGALSDSISKAKNFQKANFVTKHFSRIEQRIATVSMISGL